MAEKLISVVITCFNHGKYLNNAIESVLDQSYPHYEIIVIDDGSTDNSKAVATSYAQITYVYQPNHGVSSARNLGIKNSKGDYICFLDADDCFLPQALETNLRYIQTNNSVAFVSGAYMFAHMQNELNEFSSSSQTTSTNVVLEPKVPVVKEYYKNFLKGNYVGMHAAVLYQRWVLNEFQFDTTIHRCEDYDLFLRITRKYEVIDQCEPIAVYRVHAYNTTANSSLMLEAALNVLDKQRGELKNQDELKCLNEGKILWAKVYSDFVYQNLIRSNFNNKFKSEDFHLLWIYDKRLYFDGLIKLKLMELRKLVKKIAPPLVVKGWRKLRAKKNYTPPTGKIKMGDFERLDPFSRAFGYDRGGGPVDRYYVENFLEKNAPLIKGRVLEIGDNEYTLRFGGSKITKSDILHVSETNPQATFIGDLTNAPQIPANTFDCIILTQTLHLIYDYKEALNTCYRILKPGGVLLLTTPGITSIDSGEWKSTWYWAFTDIAVERFLAETFSKENIMVEAHGNVMSATAFLYGMGLQEIKKFQMDHYDPSYQVTITAIATKN